jgi:exopolyphosphatase / guanosine-5'-triphosphate,3'-diphosphate pyrophosphatase
VLAEEALERVFTAADEYAAILEEHGVQALRFCATSAARDAGNAAVFFDGIRARLDVEPELLSGAEEAQLAYDGATRSLPGVARPVLVVDIGGGSTELILGDPGGDAGRALVTAAESLDIGSVRITERLLRSDPPSADEIRAATHAVDEALERLPLAGVRLEQAATVVGVAGTVTTVAAVLLGLERWDRAAVHHARFPVADVHALTERVLRMTVAQRTALHIPEGRADVIGAGALILDRVLARAAVDSLLVSDADILDGIAWSLAVGEQPSGYR